MCVANTDSDIAGAEKKGYQDKNLMKWIEVSWVQINVFRIPDLFNEAPLTF